MRLHEYQASSLMFKYNIPIPLGAVAFNAKEAYFIARRFGADYRRNFVVKAQIQAGGRNQGVFKESGFRGGIHVCSSPEEVQEAAKQMCGKILVCPESGPQGYLCRCVYIVEELDIAKELYVSVKYDRKQGCPVIIYGNWNGHH